MAKVRISGSILHRLDACEPERTRWRRFFGQGETEINDVVADIAIRHNFNLPWFVQHTCGPKTFRTIERQYRDATLGAWEVAGATRKMFSAVASGDIAWDGWGDRLRAGDPNEISLLRCGFDLCSAERHQATDGVALWRLVRVHSAAYHLLTNKNGEPRQTALPGELARIINDQSRVINRAISLAGVK